MGDMRSLGGLHSGMSSETQHSVNLFSPWWGPPAMGQLRQLRHFSLSSPREEFPLQKLIRSEGREKIEKTLTTSWFIRNVLIFLMILQANSYFGFVLTHFGLSEQSLSPLLMSG